MTDRPGLPASYDADLTREPAEEIAPLHQWRPEPAEAEAELPELTNVSQAGIARWLDLRAESYSRDAGAFADAARDGRYILGAGGPDGLSDELAAVLYRAIATELRTLRDEVRRMEESTGDELAEYVAGDGSAVWTVTQPSGRPWTIAWYPATRRVIAWPTPQGRTMDSTCQVDSLEDARDAARDLAHRIRRIKTVTYPQRDSGAQSG